MELDQALSLLKEFGEANKIQAGALNLVEVLVKNNVPVNGATQFCADHFMTAAVADYYKEFFTYVANLKKETKDTTTEDVGTLDTMAILKSIDSTLKEILTCLKTV